MLFVLLLMKGCLFIVIFNYKDVTLLLQLPGQLVYSVLHVLGTELLYFIRCNCDCHHT